MLDIRQSWRRFLDSESHFKAVQKECATPPYAMFPTSTVCYKTKGRLISVHGPVRCKQHYYQQLYLHLPTYANKTHDPIYRKKFNFENLWVELTYQASPNYLICMCSIRITKVVLNTNMSL